MEEYKHCIVVAVTGGMGCGQTTVASFFKKFGAYVVNADEMAKKAIDRNDELRKKLKQTFGSRIFHRNGKLNRKKLASMVFQDESKLTKLNKLVHPHMVENIIEEIEKARESGKYKIIMVDAALIYEINIENMFDAVIVVASYMKNRIERIMKRDGHSRKHILDRISKQIPIEDKMKWADYIIENNKDLKALEEKSRIVWDELLKLVEKKKTEKPRLEL
ncbi:MAG: dephospho-CoA kinase [Calditrichia bacterium]